MQICFKYTPLLTIQHKKINCSLHRLIVLFNSEVQELTRCRLAQITVPTPTLGSSGMKNGVCVRTCCKDFKSVSFPQNCVSSPCSRYAVRPVRVKSSELNVYVVRINLSSCSTSGSLNRICVVVCSISPAPPPHGHIRATGSKNQTHLSCTTAAALG